MALCEGSGPEITPPEATSDKDKILAILGMEEMEITATVDGVETDLIVLARIPEEE